MQICGFEQILGAGFYTSGETALPGGTHNETQKGWPHLENFEQYGFLIGNMDLLKMLLSQLLRGA